MKQEKDFLTVKEAADVLDTSRVQIRKIIRSGELPAIKVGREYRIPEKCLWAFIEDRMYALSW